jgi:hypothetical protein
MTTELCTKNPSTLERAATIHFNDALSDVLTPPGASPIYDFDADLTAQVRNTGRFADAKFAIGPWTSTGDYGAVLLSELRQEQHRLLGVFEEHDLAHLSDAEAIRKSLGQMVVGVVNWAVRRQDHHERGQNGDPFYIAELDNGIQIVSQMKFLRGVASRGLVNGLWLINDENPVWPRGEQFRSSIASQLRNFPDGSVKHPLGLLPKDDRTAIALGYSDKYGNGRLEKPEGVESPEIIPGEVYCIKADGHELKERAIGVTSLTGIPEGWLGIYANPADAERTRGVSYLEIARRVANPNDPSNSAYATIKKIVLPGSDQHPDWSQVEIELAA